MVVVHLGASRGVKLRDRLVRRARRTPLVHRLAWPFAPDLRPKRWIFVVGCYNSGTTLLARLLGQHPEVAALPSEGVSLTDALPYPEQFGWTRMWCRCQDQVRLEPGDRSGRALRRIRKQWSLWLPRPAPNVLEKSIANAARMPFLDDAFSPAWFIAIVRNGYAVAEGIRRKANPARWGNSEYLAGYPISLCAEQWKVSDEVISRDRASLQRFIQIRYEDLVAEPEPVLRRLTDFLELAPLDPSVLERPWSLQGREEYIRNMNPASIARLDEDDRRAVEDVARETLWKYGYSNAGQHSSP